MSQERQEVSGAASIARGKYRRCRKGLSEVALSCFVLQASSVSDRFPLVTRGVESR